MTRDYKNLSRKPAGQPKAKTKPAKKNSKPKTAQPRANSLGRAIESVRYFFLGAKKDSKPTRQSSSKKAQSDFKTTKNQPKYKVSVGSAKTKTPKKTLGQRLSDFLRGLFRLPIFVFGLIFGGVDKSIAGLSRLAILKLGFIGVFVVLVINFIQLQVIADNGIVKQEGAGLVLNISPSTRGSIYIRDLQANNKPVEVTSSRILFNVFIEPDNLKTQIDLGALTREEAITALSGSLNIAYEEIERILDEELNKEAPGQYRVLKKFVSKEQKEAVEHLRLYGHNTERNFSHWLGIEQVEVRAYPEDRFLGSLGATLGYVQREPVARDEALNIAHCRPMVRENEKRDTVNSYTGQDQHGKYTVGLYGIEQKFCSELGGLNGRQLLGSEVGSKTEEDVQVVHGSDIFLTIDKNMQLKAQEVLDELVKNNTNSQGGPVDGTIIIMDVKENPGAILAMANYPFANPNEYYKSIEGFRNTATSVDYEVGSVMKPLTVAAALNEHQTGQVDKNGDRLGISPSWKFLGYDDKGKPFPENNGRTLYIRNADGMSYLHMGEIPISNCLRDSINTCIADIQPTIGNLKTKEYFEDRYLVGQPTLVSLPGDEHGNASPLQDNIYSDFTYATFGFGQGFTMAPLQLVRAYSPLANEGKLVEPYLVDKIVQSDNQVIQSSDLNAPESIRQKAQNQVLEPEVAQQVTQFLVTTIDQGYLGQTSSKGRVPGYTVAGKTGTAQVSRAYNGMPCGYDCNTLRGIYDHTFIGYGPVKDPEVVILIKLSEPQPGVIKNYAENTLGPGFSKMMGWTLDYRGVPKEPGR
jgi:cell division protein FtsI/penicillin-binding protein 2